MMANEFYIYLSILTPLIAFFVTPLLSSNPNLRDSLGPIGGVITFYSSFNIASLYLNGEILSYTFFQINETLSISFKITGLGVIFGLVASGLWILASIYTIGYMRGNKEKNQTRFFNFYSISSQTSTYPACSMASQIASSLVSKLNSSSSGSQ